MAPDLKIRTCEVSEATNKGKHTTTTTSLYRLPGGIEIIDTPGIRVFGLWKIAKRDLQWYFPEFEEHRSGCRFADCIHESEPECAVRRAAEEGRVPAARYDTYLRILPTLGG
jgi:ribosome biogenesis GTPase